MYLEVHFIHVYTFCFRTPPRNLDKRTTITIDEKTFVVEADDLETLCILGRGAYGIVDKMRHKQSGTIMAVKVLFKISQNKLYIMTHIVEYNCFEEEPINIYRG